MRESYVPNLKVPKRSGPSSMMWVTILLCIALPPLGLGLLWGRVRCPLRGKVWISLVSVVIMVVELTLLIGWREQATYVPPQVPVVYNYGERNPDATAAPDVIVPAGDGQAQVPAQDNSGETIIPSNPMG